ncbi:hypothetical protein CIPAW_11G209200 [Carya illinoinensis]|uniref:Uncharacterized protein n=1 Tax=Carya illinoinensis TaxID=32201 RepID=A0A8T1PAS0_CARIL|nr:hypothetical protein CIPAW_11G209200 [Carya illinoinensis]
MEAARFLQSKNRGIDQEVKYKPLPVGPSTSTRSETKESEKAKVFILENIYWKEVCVLSVVWIVVLGLQIAKNHTTTCLVLYWVLNKPLPASPSTSTRSETKESEKAEVSILENIYWKEVGVLFAVWIVVLGLQIAKNHTTTCSVLYWVLNLLQIPITVGVTSYEAVNLYKGQRVIVSKGEADTN